MSALALATQPADDLIVMAVEDHLEIHAANRGGGHVVYLDPPEGYALATWLEYLAGYPDTDVAHDLPGQTAREVMALDHTGPHRQPPSLTLPASVGVSTLCTSAGDYSIAVWLYTVDGFRAFDYSPDVARMLAQRVLNCTLIVTLH